MKSVMTHFYWRILRSPFSRGLRRLPRTVSQTNSEDGLPLEALSQSVHIKQSEEKSAVIKDNRDVAKREVKNLVQNERSRLQEPVSEDNQFERLNQIVTPLCQMPYQKQLKLKQQLMREFLHGFAKQLKSAGGRIPQNENGLACHLEAIRPSPDLIGYRNKDELGIHFGVDGNPMTVGFFTSRPTDPAMRCVPPTHLINMKQSHKHIVQHFQNYIRQSPHKACHNFKDGGIWRNIIVRSTLSGEKMAIAYIHPQQLPEEEIQEIMEDIGKYFFEKEGSECEIDSFYLQACQHTRCTHEQAPYRLIKGKEFITEVCQDLKFQISPDAFFQINTRGAEILYDAVREVAEVSPITTLLDICSGTGTISLLMAPYVRETVGIEKITGAVYDARKNAAVNDIRNAKFIAGYAEKVLPSITHILRESSDLIAVVNPGRDGLHPDVIDTIRQCEAIKKLIYISCKQEGSVLRNFVKLGATKNKKYKDKSVPFVPKYAIPVDMFPHTKHVELIMLFEREEGYLNYLL